MTRELGASRIGRRLSDRGADGGSVSIPADATERPAVYRQNGWLACCSGLAICCVALFLAAPVVRALEPDRTPTQYVHRIWQTAQGLPEGTIFSIFQTPDQYLWLAGQAGLLRFDGVGFRRLDRIVDGAPGEINLRSAAGDAQGRLWLGSNDGGVHSVRGGEIVHYGLEQGLPRGVVRCLTPAKDGTVWVCTEGGLGRIDPETQTIQSFDTSDGLTSENIWAACENEDGALWIGPDGPRLNVLRNRAFTSIELQGVGGATSVRAVVCQGNVVWAGTASGLVRLEDGQQTLYTVADGLVDDFIFSLSPGEDDTLWIGTRSGFSRLRNGVLESFRVQDGLSQGTAQSVYEDHQGSLWVGTKRGLNQFVDGLSVPYTTSEGLPSNSGGPVIQDENGIIWAGTLDAGLARFDGRRFTPMGMDAGLPSKRVNTLATSGGALWVGTDNGLAMIRDGRVAQVFRGAGVLPSPDVRSLYEDRSGTLWIGTARGLVGRRNGAFFALPGAPRDPVRALGENKEGQVVVATEAGLFVNHEGEFRGLTQDGAYLRNANAMYLDDDGLLWVGLNGAGLRLINGGEVISFFERDGFYDGEIYGIRGDERGRLWMTCSRGLFSVSRKDLLAYAAGELSQLPSFAYTPTDALRVIESRQGVQPSLWRMDDGTMWFSTIRGLLAFDPTFIPSDAPPPIVIEDPLVNGRREAPANIIRLPAGQTNIEFNYSALTYIQPDRMRFRYQLEGYDEDWVEAGNRREAFYTNLPPGDYTFRVTGCSREGVCYDNGAEVAFAVAPMIYQRAWFWPLVAGIVGLAGWGGYRLRIRNIRERYDLILSERMRIARELHDTLIQGFSGVTMALQGLAPRLQSSGEREMLEDIIQDAATCLRETRQSVAGLRSGRGTQSGLAAAIARAAREITETKEVRLTLNLDPDLPSLPAEAEYNLLRIASEAVANAVKHSGAAAITVSLRSDAEALALSISDDGSGFQNGENGGPRSGHYGLIGMKERATQIGADLELDSQPGSGTTIMVSLRAERAVEATK